MLDVATTSAPPIAKGKSPLSQAGFRMNKTIDSQRGNGTEGLSLFIWSSGVLLPLQFARNPSRDLVGITVTSVEVYKI